MVDRSTERDAAHAVLKDLTYVWRLSFTHDVPYLRAYIRRRLDDLVESNEQLRPIYEHQLQIIRELGGRQSDGKQEQPE